MLLWKRAATAFQNDISAPRNMVEVKLKPGECVIFDNQRLLHGRNEFKKGQEGGGARWLKGTYISDQVYRAMEDRVQRRRGMRLPDVPIWRKKLAVEEKHQAAPLVAKKLKEERARDDMESVS
jgi:hypothetical protein